MRVFTDLQQLPTFKNAVITIGSFDGVHAGHRRILEKVIALAADCKGESVVITFDPHPRTVLQPDQSFKLITTTAEKKSLLRDCGIDNLVIVPFTREFAGQSAAEYIYDFLVQKFHPAYIVIGYDHRFGKGREGGIEFLRRHEAPGQFKVVEIPAKEVDEIAVSSSKIRKALDASDLIKAGRLLGHPYTFEGRVVQGIQIGRAIGFPTANVEIVDPYKLILPAGIYAARARKPGERWYNAMLYIGDRPTVTPDGAQVIEVNLLDFEGDLYGQQLQVAVMEFVRGDQKFDGLEALQAQIKLDKQVIEAKLAFWEVKDTVAIVILNYKTRQHLQEFLPSVVANSPGAQIIVADNGSPDDSIAFVEEHYPQIQVIDLHQNYGFAEGYNQALRQVEAEFYVILNSDVEVTPNWLDPVLDAMRRDSSIAIAQPKIMALRNKKRFEYAGAAGGWIDALGYPFCRGRIFSLQEEDRGQYDTAQECFWAAGAAFFIRSELYHRFAGFDGDYFAHNEEIDLCWRLKRAGYAIWCIPQSVVYHLGGGTLEYESPRKVFLNFRNSLYTLLKNESAGKLFWLLPARFLLDGLAGLRFALKGQFRAIWALVQAHFSFYKHFGKTIRKRREVLQIIENHRIKPSMNRAGIFPGSIVWGYYAKRIKRFAELRLSQKQV